MPAYKHAAFSLLLALAACSGDGAQENAALEAAAPERASMAVTHYTDATEMFVEYPIPVVGQPSRFAAHLSWMADFKPVDEGRLTVELVQAGGTGRVTVPVSDTPGIFRPELTPARAGAARLVMRLEARGRTILHDLGAVTVYPSQEAANKAHPEEEEKA